MWTTLVVRLWYSNESEHRELWRNAAEFAFSDRMLGLKIDNQQGEGTGTISLYFDRKVPDELKAIFIEYVHRHLEYWLSQPVDVYLVIRQTDETSGGEAIRWMNVTRYLKTRKNQKSRQIIFDGEKLTMKAVWRLRDEFFPPSRGKAR